jgi:hypothetical protein
MKPAVKIVLAGCAIAALVTGIAIVVGVRYVSSNKDKWLDEGKKLRAEANQRGKGIFESQCVAEAMGRYRTDSSIPGQVKARIFLTGCLETSHPEIGFCDNVPASDELTATVKWRLRSCAELGFEGDSDCPNILADLQRYCHSEERAEKVRAQRP